MSVPFYVSPEQLTRDRADFARKGISRGKSVVVLQSSEGIILVADNPSKALHKVSEIYDRIAFAAVGKYNEFENLRVSGIRFSDMRGYSYDRSDVSARSLANAYAQTMGAAFTDALKPLEVEIVVTQLGEKISEDEIYRLTFDGSLADEHGFVAIGGQADEINQMLGQSWKSSLDFSGALKIAVEALTNQANADQEFDALNLEVAVLDRKKSGRAFRRLTVEQTDKLIKKS
ncbi:MAG: proteasome subunit alpha [Actinomycetota bacterium]|jgi:proteasome alpha subunit